MPALVTFIKLGIKILTTGHVQLIRDSTWDHFLKMKMAKKYSRGGHSDHLMDLWLRAASLIGEMGWRCVHFSYLCLFIWTNVDFSIPMLLLQLLKIFVNFPYVWIIDSGLHLLKQESILSPENFNFHHASNFASFQKAFCHRDQRLGRLHPNSKSD